MFFAIKQIGLLPLCIFRYTRLILLMLVLALSVSGGSYARQAITFNAAHATAGTIDNSSAEEFTNMPGCTVTHIGVWDAASSGNLLFFGAVSASKTVTAGDTISLAAGSLDITLA